MRFKKFSKWNFFLSALFVIFTSWGCSSGGGGVTVSNSGGGATGLTYMGLTSQATVDGDNAQVLTEDALAGGSTSLGGLAPMGGAVITSREQRIQRPLKVSLMMRNAAEKIKVSQSSLRVLTGAVVSGSGTIEGTCGGEAAYSITIDTVSGVFSGSITFTSYCEYGVTYDGSAGFSGVAVFVAEELQGLDQFIFDYNSITCTTLGITFTIDGTMAFADFYYNYPYPYVTMNMVYRDDGTGKTYRMENFVVSFDFEWLGSEEDGFYYAIEGTFYHPDYGYVNLTTPTWFWQYVYDAYPSYEGEFIATGAIGSEGGNTYARLVIGQINSNTYEIYADTNGDGVEDYYSGELSWDGGLL